VPATERALTSVLLPSSVVLSTTSPAGIAAEMLKFDCMFMILLRVRPQASTKPHRK
jgi:hypothetical protein